jgi:hypothetical protein
LPSTANGSYRTAEQICGFFLGHAFVEKQIDDFTLFCRQLLDPLVELGPFKQVLRLLGNLVD